MTSDPSRPYGSWRDGLPWLAGAALVLLAGAAYVVWGRSAGLADLVYLSAVVWLITLRYVVIANLEESARKHPRLARRAWRRFSTAVLAASAALYALARAVAV